MKASELRRIAAAIDAHLKRFEADPVINEAVERPGMKGMKLTSFFNAQAYATRKYVCITYIGFQGQSKLTGEEAAAYLASLDAGHVGTHRTVPRA